MRYTSPLDCLPVLESTATPLVSCRSTSAISGSASKSGPDRERRELGDETGVLFAGLLRLFVRWRFAVFLAFLFAFDDRLFFFFGFFRGLAVRLIRYVDVARGINCEPGTRRSRSALDFRDFQLRRFPQLLIGRRVVVALEQEVFFFVFAIDPNGAARVDGNAVDRAFRFFGPQRAEQFALGVELVDQPFLARVVRDHIHVPGRW